MFKPLIAATIGLSAMATFASADTLIVQSAPSGATIVQSGPNTPVQSIIAYDGPSFDRMVEMCARFGFNCDVPEYEDSDGPHPLFSDAAQADAEKRLALMRMDWEDYAANLPAPHVLPGTRSAPFGWHTGPDRHDILSWFAPRHTPFSGQFPRVTPNGRPFGWGHGPSVLPRMHGVWGPNRMPQITIPHIERPRIAAPHFAVPRPAVPRFTHPRALPHGGLIPWPTL